MLSRFSPVWLFATPWPGAHQAPLSMRFSRQEYWGILGLPCPFPGDLPNLGIKPAFLMSSALARRFFITGATARNPLWETLLGYYRERNTQPTQPVPSRLDPVFPVWCSTSAHSLPTFLPTGRKKHSTSHPRAESPRDLGLLHTRPAEAQQWKTDCG